MDAGKERPRRKQHQLKGHHGGRGSRELHGILYDALGNVILHQEGGGSTWREGYSCFLHQALEEKPFPLCGHRGVSEPVVAPAHLRESVPTLAGGVCLCAPAHVSEGCSNRVLLMLQKHRKAGLLIQSFMLPLFRRWDLIDKNTQANDQFHGLFPLLSIQGIVSCRLVPPLWRQNSNIYNQLLQH